MKSESNQSRMAGAVRAVAWLALMLAVGPGGAAAEVVTYPAPGGEPLSADYEVTAEGRKVDVYTARVLDPPFAGKEWDYGGSYSFANFDAAGRVEVRITSKRSLRGTVIRPRSAVAKVAEADDHTLVLTLDGPHKFSVEPEGKKGPLLLFANPLEENPPAAGAPGVIYFGPGIHEPGRISLTNNQTLYLAGGAVVKGGILAEGENIRIAGRGILDNSGWAWREGPTPQVVSLCGTNILVEGITIRGAARWTVVPRHSRNVTVRGIKLCGARVQNDDGVNPCNSQDVRITDCFIRTDDDCVALKGLDFSAPDNDVERITVENCVLWCDRARIFLLGHESRAGFMRHVTLRNLDIIHFTMTPFLFEPGEDMRLEDIRVENVRLHGEGQRELIRLKPVVNQYMRKKAPGYVRDVRFKNVSVEGADGQYLVQVEGADAEHNVRDVTFENVTINGVPLAEGQDRVRIGGFAEGVHLAGKGLRSLDPPVLLPDGAEFKTWEAPLDFSRTYYVDGSSPAASDDNPGTRERPFATINRAAQVLAPGERVVVETGVYRERICPARGGTGPDRMISYEAAPGARVVLKGSRVFGEAWTAAETVSVTPMWQARLDPKYFTGYNPFDIENVTARQFEIMDFARPLQGTAPCKLPRGLVFQDGRRLTQVSDRSDLEGHEGCYWVDRAKQMLFASFFGWVRPNQTTIEITTQETIFAPEQIGLGYIRVKGFTVEQAAGPFPWEQVGAISTTRGHHWIIEENTVRQVNGVGIDAGIQLHQWPQPPAAGFHIVRRNTVTDCGICGICGLGPGGSQEFGLLIEDNVLLRNAFHDTERLYETAGIKTHDNVHCLIRRNIIVDTRHGAGIWMDWDNRNSRCCQNIIVNANTMHGGIFVEASFVPNLIDQNFIWGTQGHGIYEHDCSHQVFAHNFIGQSTRSGLHLHGKITNRRIGPGEPEYGAHQVMNNVLYQNAKTNVFGGRPSTISGNLSEGITAAFDARTLELTWSAARPSSECDAVPGVGFDFFGRPRTGPKAAAGPFDRIPAEPSRIKLSSATVPDASGSIEKR
jgi:hypothetical protein